MEKIVKYNSFDDDIVPGDIVVFSDRVTRRKIQKIDGHKVTFTDGFVYDLFVVPILGIIKVGYRDVVPITQPTNPFISEFDSLPPAFEPSKDYLTYQELFRMMEKADHSNLEFSKYFWHCTTGSNLIQIIKSGKFKARYEVEGHIPYDNKIHNKTSRDVMFNNLSKRTGGYVRFYLRLLNKPYFALYSDLSKEEKELFAIVCIRKEALKDSFRPTYLYYQTANKATDDVFDKSNSLNKIADQKISLKKFDKFNFEETYTIYNSESQDKQRTLYQEAEFLVFKELSTYFIDRIIFKTYKGLNFFLNGIKGLDTYYNIKRKCIVNYKYFGYKP